MTKKKQFWIILAACFMGLVLACNRVVWGDEAYTFRLIRHTYLDVLRIDVGDVHPPLYYYYLKPLVAPFGYNLYWTRLVSFAPTIATLVIAWKKLGRLAGERVTVLFMVLFLAYPFAMNHLTEVRSYPLLQMMVFLCGLSAWAVYQDGRRSDWIQLVLGGLGAAYIHYFALVSVGFIFGMLLLAILIKKRALWKGWCLAAAACIIGYLPWVGPCLYQMVYKVDNDYWIPEITLRTFYSYAQEMFGTEGMDTYFIFCAGFFALCFVLLLWKGRRKAIALLALAVPLGTMGFGLAFSALVRPIFVIRYILPCAPLVIFFLAWSLEEIGWKNLTAAVLTLSVAAGASNFLILTKHAIVTPDYSLSGEFVDATRDAECYLVYNGADNLTSQVLAHYAPEKMIYSNDVLPSGNPFTNWIDADTFDEDACRYFVLMMQSGTEMPQRFAAFTPRQLNTFNVYGTEMTAWEMKR